MGRLSDILNGSGGNFSNIWDSTAAAGEFGPLPPGEYECDVSRGELETSRSKGTPGYKIEFTVRDGEFRGRKFWVDCWLTAAALPATKRDLGKLGITSLDQLERPLPRGIVASVKAVLRRDDDGTERNRVQRFAVLRIEPPEVDPFAPADSPASPDEAGPAFGPDDPFAATEG